MRVLSPLTDDSEIGISAASYGLSLATGKTIETGEAVGVIAAQSIGEPGTQLTMRTFHTGGIAGGGDIAGGLPRVVELFEARSPKGKATLTRLSGVVRIADDEGKGRVVTVVADDGTEESYTVPSLARLEVTEGQEIHAGDPIVEGPRDPKELLEIKGVRETQAYLVAEVQKVYRDQGVPIHDKHIELIVRQMTRRVAVQEPGDSDFLPGERVDQKVYTDTNRALVTEGKIPAEGRPELMGITKASLATDSWLSAASFQETTRVLTEAAIESRSDSLLGLKENIIIGKLIPAGTGMAKYRDITTNAPDYQPMEFYTSADEEQDIAEWLAGRSDTPARSGRGAGHRPAQLRDRRLNGRRSATWVVCRKPSDARSIDLRPSGAARPWVAARDRPERCLSAHHPAAGPQGPPVEAGQGQDPGSEGRAPATGRLHPRVHHHPQEAELRPPQGGPRAAHERHGGHRLHPRRGPQPPGALDRARPRRSCEGPAGRALQDHPRHPRHVGRARPQAGPQPLRREEGELTCPAKVRPLAAS